MRVDTSDINKKSNDDNEIFIDNLDNIISLNHILKSKDNQLSAILGKFVTLNKKGNQEKVAYTLDLFRQKYFNTEDMWFFLDDSDDANWIDDFKNATLKKERARVFEFFGRFDKLSHTEMIIASDGKRLQDFITKIIDIEDIKKLILKDKHDNWTLNENTKNHFQTLQGFMLKSLTHNFLLSSFKFVDKIDSQNVEYNHPFARDRIRVKNRESEAGIFWIKKFGIKHFCEVLLITHFPNTNGIWIDFDHTTHVRALEFIKNVLEFGLIENEVDFFGAHWTTTFLSLIENATMSLKRLEEGWSDRWQKTSTQEINFGVRDLLQKGTTTCILHEKLVKVADYICQCKENLGHIITLLLISHYDTSFMKIYPSFIYKGASFVTEDAEMETMQSFVEDEFPFYQKSLNNSILNVIMRYCLSTKKLGYNDTINNDSRNSTEKAFMFITTKDRDCFITSLRQVTQTDYIFFETYLNSDYAKHKNAKILRDSLLAIIHDMAQGVVAGKINEVFSKSIRTSLNSIEVLVSDEETKKASGSVKFISGPEDNSNLKEQIILICKKISRLVIKDDSIKYILARHSIPQQLLSLVDYLTQCTENSFYSIICQGILDVIYQISKFNNLAKAQIFKGDGAEHLFRLLDRKVSQALVLCIKLTNQVNIGAYISKEIQKRFVKVYESLIKDTAEDYNPHNIKNNKIDFSKVDINLHTNQFLISRFFDRLFEKSFINERQRIANMFMIQQILFKILTDYMIPTVILICEDQDLAKQKEEDLVKKTYYASGNEADFFFLSKEKEFTVPMIKQLLATVCIGTLKVFNKVIATAFSMKVLKKIQPTCEIILHHIGHIHWIERSEMIKKNLNREDCLDLTGPWLLNTYHNPDGKNAELLRIIEKFKIMPESNILIDRKNQFTQRDEICENKDEILDLLTMLIFKINEFTKETQDQGILYILGGVFPMIYKFVKGLRTGTNYRDSKDIKNSTDAVTRLIEELSDVEVQIKELFQTKNATVCITFSIIQKQADNLSQSMMSVAKFDRAKASSELQEICSKILIEITKIYEIQPHYMKTLMFFKDSSKLQYKVNKKMTRFNENRVMNTSQKERQRVLNKILRVYKLSKSQYLDGRSEVNQLNFFLNNTDNLRGVYESTLDILYHNSNCEEGDGNQDGLFTEELALNPMVNKFWTNPSIQFYIKMLSKLFLAGSFTRNNFFKFMNEDSDGVIPSKDEEFIEMNNNTTPEYVQAKENPDIDRGIIENNLTDPRRRRIIDFLIKLSCDIMFYLIEKPTINNIWWNQAETYDMIIKFMKNLAEGNHISYKIWMSAYVPSSVFDANFNPQGCNVIEVYVSKFCYIINYSMLLENRESNIMPTDQAPRIMAQVTPNLEFLNEMATGPCKQNQKIILSIRYLPVWPILSRFIDDLSDEWYEMQTGVLGFVRSLLEAAEEHIIKRVANRFPISNIEDLIFRLTKKMYIREKIMDNTFKKSIRDTIKVPKGLQGMKPNEYITRRSKKVIRDLKLKDLYTNTTERSLKIWGQVDILKDNLQEKTDDDRNIKKLKEHEINIMDIMKKEGLKNDKELEFCFDTFCDHPDHHKKHSAETCSAVKNIDDGCFSDLLITRKRISKIGDIRKTLEAQGYTEDDVDFNVITSEAENLPCLEIKHWKDLLKIYLSSPRFAGSVDYDEDLNMESQNIFNIIFIVLSIWETLNTESIEHKNRYNELKTEAIENFKDDIANKAGITQNKENSSIIWFYMHISGKIEVNNNGLNMIYIFPLRPATFILSSTMKEDYRQECDISDANTKMIELMNRFPVFHQSMDNDLELYRNQPFIYSFAREDSFKPIQTFLYFIGVICNILMFVDLRYKTDDIEQDHVKPVLLGTGVESVIRVFGITMVVLASLGLLVFAFYRFETEMKEKEIIFKKKSVGEDPNGPINSGKIVIIDSFQKVPFVFSMIVHIFTYIMFEINSNAWLVLNLLLIVNISSTCKNVLMAVINHWDQLALTFVMLMFVILFFTLIIVENFIHFLPDEISCGHLHKCFWQIINDGLRAGGGIGDVMDVPSLSNNDYFVYMFFQVSFFIVVNTIFLNVIFGKIIFSNIQVLLLIHLVH